MDKTAYLLYCSLEKICLAKKYITKEQSDTITRKGHRKHGLWKRHILDLSDFVLWKLKDRNIKDKQLVTLLENSKEWCLKKT